ncbi:MAG: uroporphyrinogen decarboxylase family protein, partial [Oliverpabstia sp.]
IMRDEQGLLVLEKPGIVSIPSVIGTSLTDRKSWEELYLPRLQWQTNRVNTEFLQSLTSSENRDIPIGLHCGSLIGYIRNLLGVEQLSYLYVDDEDLYAEIIDTIANLAYQCVERALKSGAKFDYAHFWEDICFKNGPLISPHVFEEYVGPHYKKITSLLNQYGIDIVSVDCDGLIDSLLPIWLENGVNTMFPIEVGTWKASIAPWRQKYGKELRGVGGMNKTVFAKDYKAIDEEIERLKPLIELGGYIPCPDHRIAPDAKFENVQYYCEKMHNLHL